VLAFIDECLPADSFRSILEDRGHTVKAVGDAFPSGSPDPAILAAAIELGAVVFTADSDWRLLVRRIATEEGRGFVQKRAGRVLFRCPHPVAIRRLEELIEDIEREFELARRQNRPLLMWITGGNFRVER
jgi:hypothetical protein